MELKYSKMSDTVYVFYVDHLNLIRATTLSCMLLAWMDHQLIEFNTIPVSLDYHRKQSNFSLERIDSSQCNEVHCDTLKF